MKCQVTFNESYTDFTFTNNDCVSHICLSETWMVSQITATNFLTDFNSHKSCSIVFSDDVKYTGNCTILYCGAGVVRIELVVGDHGDMFFTIPYDICKYEIGKFINARIK